VYSGGGGGGVGDIIRYKIETEVNAVEEPQNDCQRGAGI
jgi:hypothetical protein